LINSNNKDFVITSGVDVAYDDTNSNARNKGITYYGFIEQSYALKIGDTSGVVGLKVSLDIWMLSIPANTAVATADWWLALDGSEASVMPGVFMEATWNKGKLFVDSFASTTGSADPPVATSWNYILDSDCKIDNFGVMRCWFVIDPFKFPAAFYNDPTVASLA
jgi:hypothetical protein